MTEVAKLLIDLGKAKMMRPQTHLHRVAKLKVES